MNIKKLANGSVRIDGLMDPEGGVVLRTALNAALGPRLKDETRTEQQRRADALVDIGRRALDGRKFGDVGCQVPHVNVVLDLDKKEALIGGFGPALQETVERFLCDAALSVNGSPERRTFSAPMRRALAGTQRRCQWPGCDRPEEWCDGHHLDWYARGGKTVVERGALVCRFHHRLIHEGGWDLVREGDRWVAIPPSGASYPQLHANTLDGQPRGRSPSRN